MKEYRILNWGFSILLCVRVMVLIYMTVVAQQYGAMFLLLCNYQLSDMFRPYRAIIRLYKIMVIRQGTCGSVTCGIPWFTIQYILKYKM